MKYLLNLLLCFFGLLSFNCNKEIEPIPSYLHIGNFSLSTNASIQGLNTYEITSAKLFVNGKEIGNFMLPANVPVIHTGNATIEVYPNVKENGIVNNQKYYSPYEGYIINKTLKEGIMDSIFPTTTYRTNTNFAWMEDFEDQSLSVQPYGQNNCRDSLKIIPTSTPGVNIPFTGSNYCGLIRMERDTSAIFEVSTIQSYILPNLGTNVYLELDVKSNVNFQIGIYTDDGFSVYQTPVLVVLATGNNWKKIYVNLKSETGGLSSNTRTRLFFGAFKNNASFSPEIYLDNLKLIYLN